MHLIEARLAWAARLTTLSPAPNNRWLILAGAAEPAAQAAANALTGRTVVWSPLSGDDATQGGFDGVVIGQGLGDAGLARSDLDAVARQLGPGGVCGAAVYLAPEDEKAAEYLNACLLLRDPSQAMLWSRETWERELFAAGLLLTEHSVAVAPLDFDDWIGAAPAVTALNRLRLRAMLLQAPRAVQAYLTPIQRGDRITFHLQAGFLISRRPDSA